MTRPLAKVLLVLFGLLAGLAASVGMVLLYERAAHRREGWRLEAEAVPGALPGGDERRNPYMFDPDLGYRLRPGFTGLRVGGFPHETNSLGLLGKEEIDPDPSVRKVLFLGDSVTWGDGGIPADNTFVSRIRGLAGAGYQTLNAGTNGYTTYQELLLYEKFLRNEDVSMAVVSFVPNDLFRVGFDYHPASGRFVPTQELREIIFYLRKNARVSLLQREFAADPVTAPLSRQNGDFLTAWVPAAWEEYERIVVGPLPADRERTPFVFVAFPTRAQVEAARLGAAEEVAFYPQARLAAFCRRHRIPLVDLRPVFLGKDPPEELFLDHCHLSTAGHEAVASFLWPRLAPLIPPRTGAGAGGERRGGAPAGKEAS